MSDRGQLPRSGSVRAPARTRQAEMRRALPFIVVAVGFLIAQPLIVKLGRPPSWDESIYLSQVSYAAPALPFAASRSRGIVVLVAPLAWLHSPLWIVRFSLALAAAAALAGTFAIWNAVIGRPAAWVAAALCASSWLTLFYAS